MSIIEGDGSFLIFSAFSETFKQVEIELKLKDIEYRILKGHPTTIKNNIKDFSEKRVKILLLNSEYFGAGMNLQMTTDLIFYHRFSKCMEEQIIGRAQRIGRTGALNIHYLLHANEMDF